MIRPVGTCAATIATAVVLLAPASAPGAAQARSAPSAAERGNFVIALAGGWTRDAAEAFAEDALCPERDANSWAARAGYRFAGALIAQAVVARHTGQDDAECVDGLVPPIPPTGPHTRELSFIDEKYRGYPFISTEARLALELPLSRSMRARAFGGMGVIWEKDIPVRLAGAELHIGGGSITAFAEATRWWHDVPRRDTIEQYLDGALQTRTEELVDVGVTSTLLRIGLELSR